MTRDVSCAVRQRPRPGTPARMARGALALAVAALVAGCALPVRTERTPPALELPAGAAEAAVPSTWWTSFDDAALAALVDEALANNRDLARAAARIEQSRAALRLARADALPALNAVATTGRQRASETDAMPVGPSPYANAHRVGVQLDYELDLWGRLARGSEAAREELLAGELARETLRSALAAQVVQAYAALQSIDAQHALFERAVRAQREGLGLNRQRLDAGVIGELDIRQLEAELLANETRLPQIARARAETERALALVLGRSPRAVADPALARAAGAAAVPQAAPVPAGLPSDLLQRRPDIRAAEHRLRAAGARLDAARAAYFPAIALTATLGQGSAELGDLFEGRSLMWSVLASLTQPIWNGGRLDAQSDLAKARRQEAELDYRDTVAAAFNEARDALGARAEAEATLRNAVARERALARAAQLTALRFQGGETSRLVAIEAERDALAAAAAVAEARRALASAQADVYRALGGGWRAQAPLS